MPVRSKILILNISNRENIESEINISKRLAYPMYAQWRGWLISLATYVETLINGCGCSLENEFTELTH